MIIHGNEEFKKFTQESFIEKSKLLRKTIKEMNLPKSTEVSCNQKQVSNKSLVKCTKKDIGQSQLKIDVAKVNGCHTKKSSCMIMLLTTSKEFKNTLPMNVRQRHRQGHLRELDRAGLSACNLYLSKLMLLLQNVVVM